ncbi:hypothetical protein COCVIDRAFT_114628 [Bipolaris victoriae FI3]|uniref:FAD/NAD(P)-binding domain-containing protein n=1 Tax=Bipolaris victoriae (strain FI3) TaxID=930091 RepID=W7E5C1_BIPV3|nr:hypothetical protein COCVIDRAFT_114628 [Bipolaris victoriae FI3]
MASAVFVDPNDPGAPIVQKYALEAAKRLREDGMNQYEQLHFSENERLHSLVKDIWADHDALDALPLPIKDDGRVKFLIIGAGIAGIITSIKLIKKGFKPEEILMVDTAGGVGGTWYWNRYPGLHCDVESYCYFPFLEDTGYMPQKKYSSSFEIRKYLEQLVDKFGLNSRILFRTQANKLEWNDDIKAWKASVVMRRGPEGKQEENLSFHADTVTIATGPLPYPKVPRVPGLAQFSRPLLHASRWNYDITGGSANDEMPDMAKLRNKVVGIIGTGATTIQLVPQTARFAKDVYVFQRTPPQVYALGQRDTDPEDWHRRIAAKPRWQRARREAFAEAVVGNRKMEDEDPNHGWVQIKSFGSLYGNAQFGNVTRDKLQEHIGRLLALDSKNSERVRSRISEIVKDKETAAKMTPWYPTWCKRPTFSDQYLEAFNNSNVHMVDTDGAGIDSVTTKGVVANGQEYPVDILILSTGYRSPRARGAPGARTGTEIIGRHGRQISEKWETQGVSTFQGVLTNGFPNLFMLGMDQSTSTANWSHVMDVMSEHATSIIEIASRQTLDRPGTVVIEPSAEAEEGWGMAIAKCSGLFGANVICTPGHQNLEGETLKMPAPDDHEAMMKRAKSVIWGRGIVDFTRMLERWREDGKLEGLEVTVG